MAEPTATTTTTVESAKMTPKKALQACCGYHWRGKLSLVFPIVFLPILFHGIKQDKAEFKCLYCVCVMGMYWITEAIPLYITSLLPLVLMPGLGILTSAEVCAQYFKDALVMFLGGLIIALAIQYSNLHQRVALGTILCVGCSPRRLHFGLFIVTMFISLWMSNSATTAMMCPIIGAVLAELHAQNVVNIFMSQEEEPVEPGEVAHPSKIALAYYFTAAYGSSIGGCGTLIGTDTNLVYKGIYENRFPTSKESLGFPIYAAYSTPIVVFVNTVLVYFALQFTHMGLFRPNSAVGKEVERGNQNAAVVRDVIKQRYSSLGPLSCHEIQVLILFLIMVILLFTRKPGVFPGWVDLIHNDHVESSWSVIVVVIIMFALPANYTFCKYMFGRTHFKRMPPILTWDYTGTNTPWGLIFLLGGGFALAEGSNKSGMAKMVGTALGFMKDLPSIGAQSIAILIGLALTAFTSNVATCNLIIPILSETAIHIRMHPLLMTFPASLACSLAYHLPVSTPPNAIICGFANIKTKYLAVGGILPTIIGFFVLLLNSNTWGMLIYPHVKEFPDWAEEPESNNTANG